MEAYGIAITEGGGAMSGIIQVARTYKCYVRLPSCASTKLGYIGKYGFVEWHVTC